VCAHAERGFWAVGQYYGDFTQTTDAEVVELLSHNPRAGQE
jgi:putative phosphoribosyl transferase